MRRLHLAIAGGLAVAGLGGVLTWWLTHATPLGLERSRVVLTSGDATVDGTRAVPALLLGTGSTVRTGHGNVCFNVHASRVCVGANAEVVLAELGEASAVLQANRGTVVVASVRDDLHLTIPTGTVIARAATVAIEDIGGRMSVVRALDGTIPVKTSGHPDVTLAAGDAVNAKDGTKRPRAETLEAEERTVVTLVGSWQGSAGGILEVNGLHNRVELDGADLGLGPIEVLLAEGTHTLIVRDGGHEVMHETLKLSPGQKVVRGG